MALYAIGDLHLSLTANKSMEVFGPAWEHYVDRIGESLSSLAPRMYWCWAGDTVLGHATLRGGGGLPLSGAVPLQKAPGQGQPRLLVVHGVQNEELLHGEGPYHPGLSP